MTRYFCDVCHEEIPQRIVQHLPAASIPCVRGIETTIGTITYSMPILVCPECVGRALITATRDKA